MCLHLRAGSLNTMQLLFGIQIYIPAGTYSRYNLF